MNETHWQKKYMKNQTTYDIRDKRICACCEHSSSVVDIGQSL